jgi:hypothetical protein
MAGWRPLKRRDFIRKLRALGYEGPYSGTRLQFMIFGQHRQTIPGNPEYSANPPARPAGGVHPRTESFVGRMELVVSTFTKCAH